MYEIIMSSLEKYKIKVDNSNDAVFESDFEKVVDEICKKMGEDFL